MLSIHLCIHIYIYAKAHVGFGFISEHADYICAVLNSVQTSYRTP